MNVRHFVFISSDEFRLRNRLDAGVSMRLTLTLSTVQYLNEKYAVSGTRAEGFANPSFARCDTLMSELL